MKKEEFSYLSSDGVTEIHAVRYLPEMNPKAVLQIAHGMAEYIERYEPLAQILCENGILVTGNDHLGHGESVTEPSKLGYFAKENGNACVLRDMDRLREITAAAYPVLPYFLLGHSMGSFLSRQAIALSGEAFSGVILSGTGTKGAALCSIAKLLCRTEALFSGWEHRSAFLNNIAFSAYNRRFGEKGGFEWLSANEENVRKYNADPLCGFVFTVNGFYGLFTSLSFLSRRKNIKKTPEKLPVLVISGTEDPVGDFGKGPEEVVAMLRKAGLTDVTLRLFPGDRHEILRENDRMAVIGVILDWILERL